MRLHHAEQCRCYKPKTSLRVRCVAKTVLAHKSNATQDKSIHNTPTMHTDWHLALKHQQISNTFTILNMLTIGALLHEGHQRPDAADEGEVEMAGPPPHTQPT